MSKTLLRCLLLLVTLSLSPLLAEAKDKALLIGIDKYRNSLIRQISGCENDTKLLREFLIEKLGFSDQDIRTLVNDEATELNIRNEVQGWLINGTQPGDRVFLAFSGHGTRVPDNGDDEADEMDEALAAYDVVPRMPIVPGKPLNPASGYIIDDDIGQWIANLYGRQVVMLFDSCHSGTISRAAGSDSRLESRFLRFAEEASKGQPDVYSPDYRKPSGRRDISTVTEGFLDKTVNGVVVISAAMGHQEAFSIFANQYGRRQGALTYLFVERQRSGLIPLGKLQAELELGINELAAAGLLNKGRNGEYQIPQVEIHTERTELPIFGGMNDVAWTASPEVALHNPLSQAKVKIWTLDNRRDFSITKPNDQGVPGETIPLAVATSDAGYLYIWVFSKNNEAKCLFPSQYDRQNFVAAGTYTFPRCRDGKARCRSDEMYEYFASEPEGHDVWVALVTDKRLTLRDQDYRYTWEEAFNLIGLPSVQNALTEYAKQVVSRGGNIRLQSRPTVRTWQAGVVVLNAHK